MVCIFNKFTCKMRINIEEGKGLQKNYDLHKMNIKTRNKSG